ncbi:MAG: hypothetical protein ACTMIL_12730 [Brevibacterium aurantiacum]
MTTDAFTDAATAAYEDYVRTPKMNVGTFRDRIAEAYMDAATWARDHLARQEVTDAEVLAALNAYEWVSWGDEPESELSAFVGDRVPAMRAALTAAKEAR